MVNLENAGKNLQQLVQLLNSEKIQWNIEGRELVPVVMLIQQIGNIADKLVKYEIELKSVELPDEEFQQEYTDAAE